jgi:MoaA/NifB/PqqE/SkfB family radical SAM enzyme
MYKYEDIKSIHIEPTQGCNAACPQCDRNINGGKDNPYLTNAMLSSIDYYEMFPWHFVEQLDSMYMCGNLGDPCVSNYAIEGFRSFRSANPKIWLGMNTNGGARPDYFWEDLADIDVVVTFSIDGLEDTNHLYRQKVKWERVMENVKAFINRGGRAKWDFIVFKHNEHQVEEARQLAMDMGFEKFQVKKTGRFFSTVKHEGKESHQAMNRIGKETQKLEKPDNKYINTALKKEHELIAEHGSMDRYYDTTPINCKAIEKSEIFITAEGHVFPCCWTAGQQYKWYWGPREAPIWKLIGDPDNISLRKHTIQEIVEGSFFKAIEDSWSCSSVKDGKLKVCANKCGVEFDAFTEQYK